MLSHAALRATLSVSPLVVQMVMTVAKMEMIQDAMGSDKVLKVSSRLAPRGGGGGGGGGVNCVARG